ncbi:MAG: DUF6090 family protein [Bacteroidota bacterium]
MIKLFTNIRRKLLTENRFKKYVLYAIGEIILVVIGILIALQINTWNQNKKDKKLEEQYYCRLLEDAKQDRRNYDNQLSLLREKISANNVLIQRLQNRDTPLDSIAPLILESIKYSVQDMTATTNAFEDIKSSGNLNIIKDLEVKSTLTSYYGTMRSTNSVIESNSRAVTEKRFLLKKDLINTGFIKLVEDFNVIDTSIVDLKALKSQTRFTEDIRLGLINDALFYIGLNSRNKQLLEFNEDLINSTIQYLETKCTH